jgi:hypothetical protein
MGAADLPPSAAPVHGWIWDSMGTYGRQWVFQIKLQIFEMSHGRESSTSCSRLRDGDHKVQIIHVMIAVIGRKVPGMFCH